MLPYRWSVGAMCGSTRQAQREFFCSVSSLKPTTAARNNQRPHDSPHRSAKAVKLCEIMLRMGHVMSVCLSVRLPCLLSVLGEHLLHSNDFNEIFNSQQREFIVLGLKLCTLRQLHVVWPLKNKHPSRVKSPRGESSRLKCCEVH